jgi:hypothetical protein
MEASEPNGGASSLDLSPDLAVVPGPVDRSDAVALVGFLGAGCSDQYLRLYESVALNRWIEIRVEDIVDRVATAAGEDPTSGQSCVWVRRDAGLASCEAVRASSLEGPPVPARWPRP